MPTIRLDPYLYELLYGSRPKPYMEGLGDWSIPPDVDKSNMYADTGSSISITDSLENTTDVSETVCAFRRWKRMECQYNLRMYTDILNRSEEEVSLTVQGFYVKSVNQDLLSGRA
jgi:hypothetical protein